MNKDVAESYVSCMTKYGSGELQLLLPSHYQLIQTEEDTQQDINWHKKIKSAFQNPFGSPTLNSIVAKEQPKKIVIIINDITRPFPYEQVLQPMLDQVKAAGISNKAITLLIATGMHRAMSEAEIETMLGKEIKESYRCVNHDCQAPMVDAGKVEEIPLYVNPLIMEADLLCAIGVIAPHYMAGFSGGRKSVLPGVCGRKTIELHHSLMRLPNCRTANLEGNRFHTTMVQAAKLVKLRFIANVVVDSKNQVVDLVTGDYLKAWQEGVKICRQKAVIRLNKRADVVIVSAGGFPKDINLYQAQKALENGSYCTKKGGKILLIAQCKEGLGETTFEQWLRDTNSLDKLSTRIEENFELGGHKAFAISRVAKNHRLYIYSELSEELAQLAFMSPISSINKFVKEQIQDDDLVYYIPNGANTVPLC